jgi:hypothetical protein
MAEFKSTRLLAVNVWFELKSPPGERRQSSVDVVPAKKAQPIGTFVIDNIKTVAYFSKQGVSYCYQ